VSNASDIGSSNPSGALSDLATAASLNPLSADPARLAGTIALQTGDFQVAEQRFRQAISREPGGWFAWLGDGLAASELGDAGRARRDFTVALSINDRQPAIKQALARVATGHPITPAQAFGALVYAQ
jgi:Flp pilus assembly protein TadD